MNIKALFTKNLVPITAILFLFFLAFFSIRQIMTIESRSTFSYEKLSYPITILSDMKGILIKFQSGNPDRERNRGLFQEWSQYAGLLERTIITHEELVLIKSLLLSFSEFEKNRSERNLRSVSEGIAKIGDYKEGLLKKNSDDSTNIANSAIQMILLLALAAMGILIVLQVIVNGRKAALEKSNG